MEVVAALFDDEGAVSAGHAVEDGGGGGAAGDGEMGLRVLLEQMGEKAGGEDGVADAGGGDEQDAHVAWAVARRRRGCASGGALCVSMLPGTPRQGNAGRTVLGVRG